MSTAGQQIRILSVYSRNATRKRQVAHVAHIGRGWREMMMMMIIIIESNTIIIITGWKNAGSMRSLLYLMSNVYHVIIIT